MRRASSPYVYIYTLIWDAAGMDISYLKDQRQPYNPLLPPTPPHPTTTKDTNTKKMLRERKPCLGAVRAFFTTDLGFINCCWIMRGGAPPPLPRPQPVIRTSPSINQGISKPGLPLTCVYPLQLTCLSKASFLGCPQFPR